MELLLSALAAYLIGSIPFGLILTRIAGHGDIRKIGSGNIGATNVLRTGDKKLAMLTLLLDGVKGVASILLARLILTPVILGRNAYTDCLGGPCYDMTDVMLAVAWMGLVTIIGHVFPLWLKFKGGKGVATSIGVAFGLNWMMGAAACVIWLLMAALFRYSSLSALVAIGLLPVLALIFSQSPALLPLLLISLLVIWRHKDNIQRLRAGTEPKIGKKHD